MIMSCTISREKMCALICMCYFVAIDIAYKSAFVRTVCLSLIKVEIRSFVVFCSKYL